MKTKEDILKAVKENNIELIRFIYAVNDGVVRGSVASAEALEGDLETGHAGSIATPFFGSLDMIAPDTQFGPIGEISAVPDLDTFRILPYVPNTAMIICDFKSKADHTPSELCARSTLKRLLASTEYDVKCSFENEFYLLNRDKNGETSRLDNSLYSSTAGMNIAHHVIIDIVRTLKQQGLVIEKYYPEYGGGQYEVVNKYADALGAADNQVIFKETVKGVALNHGLVASFMPKPFQDSSGSGSHFHISLWKDGRNVFYDKTSENGLSETGKNFIGGVLKHLRAVCAFTTPIVNSYKRLVPHTWASAFGCYGPDNKEAALRIVEGIKGKEEKSYHFEFKPSDATCNPYLALTAILAAGLDGIKNKIDPGQPLSVDPGDMTAAEREKMGIFRLPETLGEATLALQEDTFFKTVMGEVMCDEYVKLKRHNWSEYIHYVTKWEIDKYLDIF